MNKNRQHTLLCWLRLQSKQTQGYLHLSLLLGLISATMIIGQAWMLAGLLQSFIIDKIPRIILIRNFFFLALFFILRALINYAREQVGFIAGALLRRHIRVQLLDRLARLGPAWIHNQPSGSWSCMLLEQVEDMQEFYARYLPQLSLAVMIPLMMLIVTFFMNWVAGIILFLTAPLIPIFMALVGMGAAEANRRNFLALSRLSGYFLDRLRGLNTLRLFFRAEVEMQELARATDLFRQRTMEVLQIAFLSSGVLEFFSSISIALVAVYFGFSYLGEFNFGTYGSAVTLFSGFLILILAPEFFQPLRDLGMFYHAKARALGAAESLVSFLENNEDQFQGIGKEVLNPGLVSLVANNLCILSPDGSILVGPLNFSVSAGQRVAIVGISGSGKSSIFRVLLGFLPYSGSILINGKELRTLELNLWRKRLSWISQNPILPASTLRENILLGAPQANHAQLMKVVNVTYIKEFLSVLSDGLDTKIGEDAKLLSVGQVQRVALARALIRTPDLLLLDEPTASLDALSEKLIMRALDPAMRRQTTLFITHQLQVITDFDLIWVMDDGKIVQQGTYKELSSREGPLAAFISS
ncbi:heme ABC transporter permease/ATP-binding protein CydD [secondary endosymbiont of Heteropsylla cubana]|nr:cysteine/glutathione ABC transporter permease/ATP-binding protein CydD [secondary endosymbiont of Heteropsylla cubana]